MKKLAMLLLLSCTAWAQSNVPMRTGTIPSSFWGFNLQATTSAKLPPTDQAGLMRVWDGLGGCSNRLYPNTTSCANAVAAWMNAVLNKYPSAQLYLTVGENGTSGILPADYQSVMLQNIKNTVVRNGQTICQLLYGFETWNETTTSTNTGTGLKPAEAAKAQQAAHSVLHGCNSNIIVTSPSITRPTSGGQTLDYTWTDQFVAALKLLPGGLTNIDAWAGHGYIFAPTCSVYPGLDPGTIATVQMAGFRQHVNAYDSNEAAKKLFWTEGMNLNVSQCNDSATSGGNTSQAQAIALVRQMYILAWSVGYVDQVAQYAWNNGQGGTPAPFSMVCGTACSAPAGSQYQQVGADYVNTLYPALKGATINSVNKNNTTWTVVYTDASNVAHSSTWNTAGTVPQQTPTLGGSAPTKPNPPAGVTAVAQ